MKICKRYRIRSKTQLRHWIMEYNGHKDLRSTGAGGGIYMTKGRTTTLEERIEIVGYCIANGKDYGATVEKYGGVSYQQIYSWVRKYQEKGVNGLIDRRGKRKPLEEMTEIERLRAENKMLKAENKQKEMEIAVLKSPRNRKEAGLSGVRQEGLYLTVKELHEKEAYPIANICRILDLNRSSYYKWLHREKSARELENEDLLHKLGYLYAEFNGIYGYRRLADELNARYRTSYNYKRIYRLTQLVGLKAVIRRKRPQYQRSTPEVTAENILNRDFTAKTLTRSG